MKPDEHEFKVMGLAPYSNKKYYLPILKKLKKLQSKLLSITFLIKPTLPEGLLDILDQGY